jgi:hypothetical protein
MSKYFETVPIDQKPDKEAFKKGECRVYCMAKYGKIEEVLWYEEEKFPFPNLYTHWLREIEHLPLSRDWISVEDKLPERPEKKQYVQVQCGYWVGKTFRQFVGFYAEKHKVCYDDYDYDGEYDPVEEAHGQLYLKPGWYEIEDTPGGEYDETFMKRLVTHWQPLPEPPKQ